MMWRAAMGVVCTVLLPSFVLFGFVCAACLLLLLSQCANHSPACVWLSEGVLRS